MNFMGEKWKNMPFLGQNPQFGTSTKSGGTSTHWIEAKWYRYRSKSYLVFIHRLFRDPNKGFMGVQIR